MALESRQLVDDVETEATDLAGQHSLVMGTTVAAPAGNHLDSDPHPAVVRTHVPRVRRRAGMVEKGLLHHRARLPPQKIENDPQHMAIYEAGRTHLGKKHGMRDATMVRLPSC